MATHEFDLVPEDARLLLDDERVGRMKFLLYEFQPAKKVSLLGNPPTRIRVVAHGVAADIAPGLLSDLESRCGTALRVERR